MVYSHEKCWVSLAGVVTVVFGSIAIGISVGYDRAGNPKMQLTGASVDSNDLRWDLAGAFAFDWEAVELSTKLLKGAGPDAATRTLAVSVKPNVLDGSRLVIIDVNGVGVRDVLDQDGNVVAWQATETGQIRCYDEYEWSWREGQAFPGKGALVPFSVEIRLSDAPGRPIPSLISHLTGYIYAIYADDVIEVDIPFDPDYGWHDAEAIPDLMLRVDPSTPPCPGPLKRVNIAGPGSTGTLYRPTTPIPLYKYTTWAKSKNAGPMMGLNDPWYLRDYFPFGDYAVLRTELLDSKKKTSARLRTQAVTSNPSGDVGARCWGQTEQIPGDTYDSIRHVIAVHPIEVKIPFILENIPIPGASQAQPSN